MHLMSKAQKLRAANGLRVKSTFYGQQVKGKLWGRSKKGRLEKRRQAMEAMLALIDEWDTCKFLWNLAALTFGIKGL